MMLNYLAKILSYPSAAENTKTAHPTRLACHLDFSQGDTLVQFSTETGLPDPKPVKINTDNYFSGKLANIVYNPISDTFNGAYTSLREHHEELAACAPGVCTANNFILSPE